MADPEAQLDIELIKRKAISGVVLFTIRTFFIQIFGLFTNIWLALLLAPEIFGVYFIVQALLNFFVYFSDVGLAAALIQKKENPTRRDYVSTFTIQQIIIISLVVIGLLFSSKIAVFYNLDTAGLTLLRVLIVSLFLSSLETIPSILLERKLEFTKLVIPHIAKILVFSIVVLFLAYNNYGISSFSWAVLARGIVGVVLINIISPWKPALGINFKSAKILTSFGIPFQLNSILALVKDDLLTVFLGKVLSFAEVGYIGFAQKWSLVPIRFIVDNVNKVTFPAYSRLQAHSFALGKSIEKSLFFVTYFVYPSIFGMVAIAPKLLEVVPKYSKWEPALPLIYLFAVNAIFSAISTTFMNTLFAIGRPKIVLKLMIFWTSATWILTYPLILIYGFKGVALASAIIAVSSLVSIYFVKKEVQVSVLKNIFGPFLMSLFMFVIVKYLASTYISSILSLLFIITIGAVIYLALSFSIFRRHLIEDAKIILRAIVYKK